jgi:peptidyl-dipeptidase Dcp
LKRILLASAAALALAAPVTAQTAPKATTMPAAADLTLTQPWTGNYGGVPDWAQVTPARLDAAARAALDERRREVRAITMQRSAPTFANTIEAMERAGRTLDRIGSIYGLMTSNLNSPDYQKLDAELSPVFAAADDEINFDKALFDRVAAVWAARKTSGLDAEQQRLVERYYDGFVRSGAKLDAGQKATLAKINTELASLFSDFSTKLLADEDTWTVIDSEAQLKGLPASIVAAMKSAAEGRKLPGKWIVVNTRSAVDPFLTYSADRPLREAIWKKFKARGDNADANETNALIAKVVKLRADRARLLGYKSHAHWRMDDTMAKDPAKAMDLMLTVWKPTVARIGEEVADMQAVADKEGAKLTIEPWDYLYYAEKVRKAKYDLDQNELKPYFELENMIAASYYMAEKLYGLTFKEVTGTVSTFHPDIRVYEVRDKVSGDKVIGLFYRDDFARQYKRSGAWMTTYRSPRLLDGPVVTLASNNNNFVKGAAGEPTLISLDDATTLFHEFGHGIHYLVAQVKYPSLLNTPRDYVEFPSQVHENWLLTREILDRYAKHYKTGEPMPQALVDKVKKAETFNQGYATGEYLSAAIVDMKLHMDPNGVVDVDKFERETMAEIGAPRQVAMRHRLPQFGHLFSSDSYSAGYYSYLWSDVMASDAWAAFEDSGDVWNAALAKPFKDVILAEGNSRDRAEAYRVFRGRDPDVNALLKNRGFPTGGK